MNGEESRSVFAWDWSRKPFGVTEMFHTLIVVTVTWVYTCIKTHHSYT